MVEEPQGAQEGILHCVACAVLVSQQPARKVVCGIEMGHHQCLELPRSLTQWHGFAANSSQAAIVFRWYGTFLRHHFYAFRGSLQSIDVIPSDPSIYSLFFLLIGGNIVRRFPVLQS